MHVFYRATFSDGVTRKIELNQFHRVVFALEKQGITCTHSWVDIELN
jgi:hypothetical protein